MSQRRGSFSHSAPPSLEGFRKQIATFDAGHGKSYEDCKREEVSKGFMSLVKNLLRGVRHLVVNIADKLGVNAKSLNRLLKDQAARAIHKRLPIYSKLTLEETTALVSDVTDGMIYVLDKLVNRD